MDELTLSDMGGGCAILRADVENERIEERVMDMMGGSVDVMGGSRCLRSG